MREWQLLSHVRLCDHTDCNLPGSFAHGILQARIPKWFATSYFNQMHAYVPNQSSVQKTKVQVVWQESRCTGCITIIWPGGASESTEYRSVLALLWPPSIFSPAGNRCQQVSCDPTKPTLVPPLTTSIAPRWKAGPLTQPGPVRFSIVGIQVFFRYPSTKSSWTQVIHFLAVF